MKFPFKKLFLGVLALFLLKITVAHTANAPGVKEETSKDATSYRQVR